MLTGQGRSFRSRGLLFVQAMSEEQLKAAETEATAQVEEGVEVISEEDLVDVAGGAISDGTSSIGVRSNNVGYKYIA